MKKYLVSQETLKQAHRNQESLLCGKVQIESTKPQTQTERFYARYGENWRIYLK